MQSIDKQQERSAGRFAAKEALAKALYAHGKNVVADEIEIVAEQGQKPRAFARGSQLPDFSISHNGGLAIAAVAPDRFSRIGIDIEGVRDFNPATERAFLTEREYARVGEYAGEARRKVVTLHWCIKEAYLKAVGVGLVMHPRRLEIGGDLLPGTTLTLSQDGQPVAALIHWAHYQQYLVAQVLVPHG